MRSLIQSIVLFIRRKRYRLGRELIFWPAKDLRRDVQIADVSRLDDGIIGIRLRTVGCFGFTGEFPSFGEVRHIRLCDLRKEVKKLNAWPNDSIAIPIGTPVGCLC